MSLTYPCQLPGRGPGRRTATAGTVGSAPRQKREAPVFTYRAAKGGRVPNPHPILTGHPLRERPGAAPHEGETAPF